MVTTWIRVPRVPVSRIAVIGALVVVIGCAGPGGSPQAQSAASAPGTSSSPSAEATTAAPAAPTPTPTKRPLGSYEACDGAASVPITLTVRDAEEDALAGGALVGLNREFEAANPGVTIRREAVSPDDLAASVVADLGRTDGPDVAQVPQGLAGLGAAVQAGVALPLDEAAAAYGWGDRWAPRTLARMRLSDDGRTLGEGSLYGVPVTGEIVNLFLSDRIAHSRPLRDAPQTLAEDMDDLAAIKEAGVTPILVGGGDGGMRLLYGLLLGSLATPEWLDAFVYGQESASFNVPETTAAARLLVELRDQGFLADGSATMTSAEAYDRFVNGGAQFLVAGSSTWPALTATGDSYMAAGFSPKVVMGTVLAPAGTGRPFVVRQTSDNRACATAYLDFITSDHAMEQVAATELVLPSHVPPDLMVPGWWFKIMAYRYRDIESANQLGHDLDWAFPGAAETLDGELAKLLAGKTTPEQFAANVDAAYQAAKGAD